MMLDNEGPLSQKGWESLLLFVKHISIVQEHFNMT